MTPFPPPGQVRGPGGERRSAQPDKWVILILCGVPTVVGLLIGMVFAVGAGRYGLAALAFGAAAFFVVGLGANLRPSLFTPIWSVDEWGTTLRVPKSGNTFGMLMISAFSLLLLGGAVLMFFDPASFSVLSPDESMLRWMAPLYALGAIGFAAFFVVQIRRRGGYHLRFTPDGFLFADGTLDKQGRWAEVRDLRDSTPQIEVGLKEAPLMSMKASGLCPLTLVLADGRTPYIQDVRNYAGRNADPLAFRDWVRFYWEHPLNRGELATGGALQRLADMQAWLGRTQSNR